MPTKKTTTKTSTRKTAASSTTAQLATTTRLVATSKPKEKLAASPILQAVHETADDLHSAGLIDQTTMREFDALCLPEVPNYKPSQIKAIRTRCNASQAVFAQYLNVTTSSLQKWEIGTKRPSGVALKLLNLVDRKGIEILT